MPNAQTMPSLNMPIMEPMKAVRRVGHASWGSPQWRLRARSFAGRCRRAAVLGLGLGRGVDVPPDRVSAEEIRAHCRRRGLAWPAKDANTAPQLGGTVFVVQEIARHRLTTSRVAYCALRRRCRGWRGWTPRRPLHRRSATGAWTQPPYGGSCSISTVSGEAGGHSERALQVGRATGQDQLLPGVNATLGVACCMLRRLAEAAELLDAAIEAGRLSGNPQALAWALFCRAFVALPAGDIQVAIATAEESLNLATTGGHGVIAARAAAVLAIARITAGEPARAPETLTDMATDPFHALPDTWRAYFHELMTRYWLARGNLRAAERSAADARS